MSRRVWTINKCKVFASKCKTRTEMLKRFPRAYDAAVTHKWVDTIFSGHPNKGYMLGKKPSGYWTQDRIVAAAARCQTRKEFQDRYRSAYRVAWVDGLLDALFANHKNQGFSSSKVRMGHWKVKANCAWAAKQCQTRSEFEEKYRGAYKSALHHGWSDEICKHMKLQGNRMKRFIYEFVDAERNEVYVGLTYNVEQRLANHRSKGRPEIRAMLKRSCEVKVSSRPFPVHEARLEEARLVEKWKMQGFIVWNQVRAGALGAGSRYWTFDRCQAVADKCKNREEFRRKFNGAAQTSVNRGWLDKIFKNHPNQGFKHKPHGYWTLARSKAEAKKFKTKMQLKKNAQGAYNCLRINGLLEDFFPSRVRLKKAGG